MKPKSAIFPQTWYRATKYSLDTVIVDRETEASIFFNGRKHAKNSTWEYFRPSKEEANQMVVLDIVREIQLLEAQLLAMKRRLDEIRARANTENKC